MADLNCKLTPICHIRMISERPSTTHRTDAYPAFVLTFSLVAERSPENVSEGSFVRSVAPTGPHSAPRCGRG